MNRQRKCSFRTNEAVTGADQLLASIKEKDARIKELEALRQHIFDCGIDSV